MCVNVLAFSGTSYVTRRHSSLMSTSHLCALGVFHLIDGCVCVFLSADSSHRQNQLSAGGTGTAKRGESVDLAVKPEKGRGRKASSH